MLEDSPVRRMPERTEVRSKSTIVVYRDTNQCMRSCETYLSSLFVNTKVVYCDDRSISLSRSLTRSLSSHLIFCSKCSDAFVLLLAASELLSTLSESLCAALAYPLASRQELFAEATAHSPRPYLRLIALFNSSSVYFPSKRKRSIWREKVVYCVDLAFSLSRARSLFRRLLYSRRKHSLLLKSQPTFP